ncbi:MAG: peptidoglycan bridge formation glycyltransferase FemA/FemB family protein [Dehalococcoidia bacterium]
MALDTRPATTTEVATADASRSHGNAGSARLESLIRAASSAEWDRFVTTVRGGDQVQSSPWGEVKRASGMTPVLAIVRHGDEIVGGAQVILRRLPAFGTIGYVPLGPLYADDPVLPDVIAELRRCMRTHRVRALVVQPPFGGGAVAAALTAEGAVRSPFEVAPSATLIASLEGGEAALFERLRSSVRRNVRQSERAGVTVRELAHDELSIFHRLHEATAQRQRFDPISLERLHDMWDALGIAGMRVFVAEFEGSALAGAALSSFGRTLTYKIPGSERAGKLRPADVLHWQIMRRAAAEGFHWYDLGGVPRDYALDLVEGREPAPHPELGPAEFKRGLGGIPVVLPEPLVLIPSGALRATFRWFAARPRLAEAVQGWLDSIRRA